MSQIVLASFLLVSFSWMFHYYFYKVPHKFLPAIAEFYQDLDYHQLILSEQEIRDTVSTGSGTDFQRMAVRAAFLRFILDSLPGGVFEQFMDQYQEGLWCIPATSYWRQVFSDHVAKWENDGNQMRTLGKATPRPDVSNDGNGNITLHYSNATTPQIGRSIEVIVYIPPGTDTTQPMEYKWTMEETTPAPGRIVYLNQLPNRPDTAVITLDFSTEMEWYITGRNVLKIVISSPSASDMEVLAVRHRAAAMRKPANI